MQQMRSWAGFAQRAHIPVLWVLAFTAQSRSDH